MLHFVNLQAMCIKDDEDDYEHIRDWEVVEVGTVEEEVDFDVVEAVVDVEDGTTEKVDMSLLHILYKQTDSQIFYLATKPIKVAHLYLAQFFLKICIDCVCAALYSKTRTNAGCHRYQLEKQAVLETVKY